MKTGSGTFILSGANTYTGATTVNGGMLRLGATSALPNSTAVSVASGATLDLNNQSLAIGSLTGVAGSSVTLGTGILTTGSANAPTTFLGTISGSGGLTKTGTATFTLGSSNTFTGATTINAGTLALTGDAALDTSTSITVNSPGTLNYSSGAHVVRTGSRLAGTGNVVVSGGLVTIQGTYGVSGSTSITSGTVLFNGSGLAQTLAISGGSFQALSNLDVTNAALSGGELGGAGTLSVANNGHLDWSGGTMDGSGMTMISAGGQMNLLGSGDHYQTQRRVCNAGTVIWGGAGGIWWTGTGADIENESGGSFDFGPNTDAQFRFNGGSASFTNDAGAVFRRSNPGTTAFDANVTFTNSGMFLVQSGTVSLGAGSSSTTFTVSAGATLNFAGGSFTANAISGAGAVTFSGGSTTVQSYTVTGATSVAGGAVTFAQAVSFASLAMSSGTLTGMAPLTVTQVFTWSGGTLVGPATMTVPSAAQLNLNGSSDVTLDNGALSIAGTAAWSGSGNLDLRDGATLTIQPDGLLDAQSDANLNALGGTGTSSFANDGTFRKSGGGAGATVVNIPFTNSGTLDLQTGTLSIPGQFRNFSGGTLSGGSYRIAGTLQFNQANVVDAAAQLTLNGPAAQIADLNGNSGLANLAIIDSAGSLALLNGYVLTTGGDLSNFGYLLVDATSQLLVSGNYTQGTAATLEIQLGGAGGPAGQVNVAGAVNLNGALVLTPVNGYVPTTGDSFAVLTYGARSGSDFANPPPGFTESFDDGNGVLTVIAQ